MRTNINMINLSIDELKLVVKNRKQDYEIKKKTMKTNLKRI